MINKLMEGLVLYGSGGSKMSEGCLQSEIIVIKMENSENLSMSRNFFSRFIRYPRIFIKYPPELFLDNYLHGPFTTYQMRYTDILLCKK